MSIVKAIGLNIVFSILVVSTGWQFFYNLALRDQVSDIKGKNAALRDQVAWQRELIAMQPSIIHLTVYADPATDDWQFGYVPFNLSEDAVIDPFDPGCPDEEFVEPPVDLGYRGPYATSVTLD